MRLPQGFLKVTTGDLDGDGTDEVIAAVVDDNSGTITLNVLEGSKSSGYSLSTNGKTYQATQDNSTLSIEVETGQLDRDAGLELIVLTSETRSGGRNGSPGSGQSNYWIYDDLNSDLEEQTSDRVSAFVDGSTYDGVTGTLAVGDIDGDNLDEVVVAALAESFPVTCEPVTTLQFAIDDLVNNQGELAASIYTNRLSSCESSGNNGWTSYLWADILDVDGDGYQEVHDNGVVFDDFFNSAPFELLLVGDDQTEAIIDTKNIFQQQNNNGRLRTTRSNTVLTVGDVTADGYEDILVYMPGPVALRQVTNGNSTFWETGYAVTVWGIDPATGEWGQKYFEELETSHTDEDSFGPPVITAVNIDDDSTLLKFSEGSHRVVFTEPLVLAALAAPPCWSDGVQVTDVCQNLLGQRSQCGCK